MRVLITGSAGFIGSALSICLLERGDEVIGIDNHNDYYDPALKEARLARHAGHPNYSHFRLDLVNREGIAEVFSKYKPNRVVNLAAQAGVRHSLTNPYAYIDTNLVGFANLLEGCRENNIEHFVYASSSSIYGLNTRMPLSEHDCVDHPLSLYAATKKANESMAHTYSHLYNLPSTGLRIFTVYGPWARPDMALQKFTKAIINDEPITLYNYGNHRRDFTYIDDVVEAVIRVLDKPAEKNPDWNSDNPDPATSSAPWRIYNIGNNHPVELNDYINALENALGKKANKELLPLQPGDVHNTYADIENLISDIKFKPATTLEDGVASFVEWYKQYYK